MFKTKSLTKFGKAVTCNGTYQPSCRHCKEDRRKQKQYGVNNKWFKRQSKNGCQLCGLKKYKSHTKGRSFCIDHDHKTGKARGVLCQACNIALARFFDNKKMYNKIMKYIARGHK
jgi:Autographiviridae endonuclease VII